MTWAMRKYVKELEDTSIKAITILDKLPHGLLCDPECEGRCKLCPADAIEDIKRLLREARK